MIRKGFEPHQLHKNSAFYIGAVVIWVNEIL
jgi:hypothetical protein